VLTGTRSVCPERTALDQRELMPVWGVSRRLLDLDRVYGVGRSEPRMQLRQALGSPP